MSCSFDDIQVSSGQCGFGDFSPILPEPPLTNGRVPPSTDPGGAAGALPAAPLPEGTPLPAPTFDPPMDAGPVDIDALAKANPDHWMKSTAIRALAMDGVAAANSESINVAMETGMGHVVSSLPSLPW